MWTWLVLACTADPAATRPSPQPPSPPVVQTADTGSAGGGATGALVPPRVVPMIDEALASRCPLPGAFVDLPPEGTDLLAVTLTDATARCNDGTPPVLYVRPATDPEHADDWVLYLEGGASCDSHERCAERWCGDERYDAAKMSTRWAPEAIRGGGILATTKHNAFAGWNVVHFYYCTSDFWVGQGAHKVLDDGTTPFRLHFEGHEVVTQALDALEAGVTSDDRTWKMPSLTRAGTVVLGGSSAGAVGAALHLDDLQARLPAADVRGVVDSMITPTYDSFPDPALADVYFASFPPVMQARDDLWEMHGDADCLADLGDPAQCADLGVLWSGRYTTTPTLLHYDLQDTVGSSIEEHVALTPEQFVSTIEASLRSYADVGLSVHGTSCGLHTSLGSLRFEALTVDDVSVQDATVALLDGRDLEVLDPTGASSFCP